MSAGRGRASEHGWDVCPFRGPLVSEMPQRDLKPRAAVKTRGVPVHGTRTCPRERGAAFAGRAARRERPEAGAPTSTRREGRLHALWVCFGARGQGPGQRGPRSCALSGCGVRGGHAKPADEPGGESRPTPPRRGPTTPASALNWSQSPKHIFSVQRPSNSDARCRSSSDTARAAGSGAAWRGARREQRAARGRGQSGEYSLRRQARHD